MNALEAKAIIGFNILIAAYVVGSAYKTKVDARRERHEEKQEDRQRKNEEKQDKIISILKEIQGAKYGR